MLRRLEKRILVDLPSQEAREAMIHHWLPPVSRSSALELRADLEYSLLSRVSRRGGRPETLFSAGSSRELFEGWSQLEKIQATPNNPTGLSFMKE